MPRSRGVVSNVRGYTTAVDNSSETTRLSRGVSHLFRADRRQSVSLQATSAWHP